MRLNIKSPLIVLAAGIILVGASSVGATRAAKVYQSNTETADFSTASLSVDLQEKQGEKYVSVDGKDTLKFTNLSSDFHIGEKYDENVRVVNNSTGEYDEYVRVTVKKSWVDSDGKKITKLDPDLIKFSVADGWFEDVSNNTSDKTKEKSVFYYKRPIVYGDGNAVDFLTNVKIDNDLLKYASTITTKEEGEYTIIENKYKYNDYSFNVEIKVDAVQTHNAKDAILGAWGIDAEVSGDGTITKINGKSVE